VQRVSLPGDYGHNSDINRASPLNRLFLAR
jgi:hypothetical protein